MKPENLMVDDKGFLRLIDLGTAKVLKGKQGMVNKNIHDHRNASLNGKHLVLSYWL